MAGVKLEKGLKGLVEQVKKSVVDLDEMETAFPTKDFNYKKELENLAKVISNSSTKLSVLAKPPAKVDESVHMCKELVQAINTLTSVICAIPKDEMGKTYLKKIKETARELFLSVADLANSFRKEPEELDSKDILYLQPTGLIWAAKDIFQKLPQNNRDAVLARWENGVVVLTDVNEEADEALKKAEARAAKAAAKLATNGDNAAAAEDDDDDDDDDDDYDFDGWDELFEALPDEGGEKPKKVKKQPLTPEQLQIAKDSVALLKLNKMLLQKTSLRVIKPLKIEDDKLDVAVVTWLDGLCDMLDELLEQVDEVCSMLDDFTGGKEEVVGRVKKFVASMMQIVNVVKEKAEGEHAAWYQQFAEKVTSIQNKIES